MYHNSHWLLTTKTFNFNCNYFQWDYYGANQYTETMPSDSKFLFKRKKRSLNNSLSSEIHTQPHTCTHTHKSFHARLMNNGCWIDSVREIVSKFSLKTIWILHCIDFDFVHYPTGVLNTILAIVLCIYSIWKGPAVLPSSAVYMCCSSARAVEKKNRMQRRLRQESKYWSRYWYFRSKFYVRFQLRAFIFRHWIRRYFSRNDIA